MKARTEGVLPRRNGENIAWSEYGDPTGEPIMFCHGWPSSRTMAELTDEAARDEGCRIISPDRPGIGDSTLVPERSLRDWPALLAELADHLRLQRFRVLGISGGAPYTYVSAWAMPERVRAVAVVSGAPEIAALEDHEGLLPLYRWLLAANNRWPNLSRASFRLARPFLTLRPPKKTRPLFLKILQPTDADSLRDSAAFEACFESQRRAWKKSAEGVLIDATIYARPWGFPLEEIRVPVSLWHGERDRSFSSSLARTMAGRLPNCREHLLSDAGHYSAAIRHMHEILRDLRSL